MLQVEGDKATLLGADLPVRIFQQGQVSNTAILPNLAHYFVVRPNLLSPVASLQSLSWCLLAGDGNRQGQHASGLLADWTAKRQEGQSFVSMLPSP